jgi:hypothetical protein
MRSYFNAAGMRTILSHLAAHSRHFTAAGLFFLRKLRDRQETSHRWRRKQPRQEKYGREFGEYFQQNEFTLRAGSEQISNLWPQIEKSPTPAVKGGATPPNDCPCRDPGYADPFVTLERSVQYYTDGETRHP